MAWDDKIFRYCERGADPTFWGEPVNALSNGAFLIAAVAAIIEIARRPHGERSVAALALAVLVFVIGVGSFLFHTYANRWSAIADVAPIGIFMLAYFAYALRVFMRAPWVLVAIGLGLFVAALNYAGGVSCRIALVDAAAARGPCLNGTVGYAPASVAMLGIGLYLWVRGHGAAGYVLAAGVVFLGSMGLRTVDWEMCALTRIGGRPIGTHFAWHILNAATLYLLLLGAIRHGGVAGRRAAYVAEPAAPVA